MQLVREWHRQTKVIMRQAELARAWPEYGMTQVADGTYLPERQQDIIHVSAQTTKLDHELMIRGSSIKQSVRTQHRWPAPNCKEAPSATCTSCTVMLYVLKSR